MARSANSSSKERNCSLISSGVLGECGYCGHTIISKKHKPLPLECFNCKGVYHVSCLRGEKPQVLLGDQLFRFTCAYCSPMGRETCVRPHLNWVHVTHLALYNLIVGRKSPTGKVGVAKDSGQKKEYFRWNEDICGFICTHWNKLMPERKRTQSWRSTVAGTLSVNCPAIFESGHAQFNEHGWWTLTSVSHPDPRQAITVSPSPLGKRSSMTLSPPPPPKRSSVTLSPPPKISVSRDWNENAPVTSNSVSVSKDGLASTSSDSPLVVDEDGSNAKETYEQTEERCVPSLVQFTGRQEKVLKSHLERYVEAVRSSPKASRLLRKLKVRELQRTYGHPLFDINKFVTMTTAQTIRYIVDKTKPYYEQVVPLRKLTSDPNTQKDSEGSSGRVEELTVTDGDYVLNRLTVISHTLPHEPILFEHFLNGGGYSQETLTSPYTARVLKPFIFRTADVSPLRVQLNAEIVGAYIAKHSGTSSDYVRKSVDFVYFREHMLSAVNCFVSHLFWPVDLSECLQYPDFTCVALYANMVIGCAFMTPDVKVNEAYISFLAVHPDFQHAHIGKVMLYHLIQACMGKDVTLHVSVNNPAMILYQKFGFKAEKYCLDFYNHYYPTAHYLSKHAYYMRLKR